MLFDGIEFDVKAIWFPLWSSELTSAMYKLPNFPLSKKKLEALVLIV